MTDVTHNLLPEGTDNFWMPFTPNRTFGEKPRLMVSARGMYYTDAEGNEVLDASAGLWCVNAGHYRPEINAAIAAQLEELDFAHNFNAAHPLVFEYASRLVKHFPDGINRVFFTNSGSESVDTALKIALAFQQLKGEGSRTGLIGREGGYHGMGFGGLTVGGIGRNRRQFGPLLPGADHLRSVLDIERNAFSRGLPAHGAELADDLTRIVSIHGADKIAAVIVEPITGAGGVVLPPQGYLQRLRELCTEHGILLIFDEVITGFGRLGDSCAANRFGVTPDIITTAKGISNATIPLGGVFVSDDVYDVFQSAPAGIELFHGYTYSGHPVACAAGMATLSIYENENLFERGREAEDIWLDAAMSLRNAPGVIDIRCHPLIAAVELEAGPDGPGTRGIEVAARCYEKGVWFRNIGDILVTSPPLIISDDEIRHMFGVLGEAIG